MMSPIREEEHALVAQWASAERVLDQARALYTRERVGLAVLFEIARNEAYKKTAKPFQSRMEEATWTRYKSVFCKLLYFWSRLQHDENRDIRPLYRLSPEQARLYHRFRDAAQDEGEAPGDEDQQDRRFLEMVLSLFRCPFLDNDYENAIISSLAVMGIRDDGGWVGPGSYT